MASKQQEQGGLAGQSHPWASVGLAEVSSQHLLTSLSQRNVLALGIQGI